jgi:O-antigen/teichoic acid export membrane protein
VTSLRELVVSWKQDHLLKRVIRNSSYLFSSNVATSILIFIQGIIAIRLIGLTSWGVFATIQTFASNINRFLSFRMSEVVLKHLAPSLVDGKKEEAAALVKAAGLTEAITSVVAFLILVLLAPWAANTFARDATKTPLYVFYGLIY